MIKNTKSRAVGEGGRKQSLIKGGSVLRFKPLPFYVYHFGRKGTPFIYLLLKKASLSRTYFRKPCSHFHVELNK